VSDQSAELPARSLAQSKPLTARLSRGRTGPTAPATPTEEIAFHTKKINFTTLLFSACLGTTLVWQCLHQCCVILDVSSCTGRCGEGFSRERDCHCDFNCQHYMECCPDFRKVCTVGKFPNTASSYRQGFPSRLLQLLAMPVSPTAYVSLLGHCVLVLLSSMYCSPPLNLGDNLSQPTQRKLRTHSLPPRKGCCFSEEQS